MTSPLNNSAQSPTDHLAALWSRYMSLQEEGAPRETISAAFREYDMAVREEWDRKREQP